MYTPKSDLIEVLENVCINKNFITAATEVEGKTILTLCHPIYEIHTITTKGNYFSSSYQTIERYRLELNYSLDDFFRIYNQRRTFSAIKEEYEAKNRPI